jgi:hypothetical protein
MRSNKSYPELISLHIPKTAGTSFRNILKNVYGADQVVRFDINEKREVKVNEVPFTQKGLPAVKVIHGHFSYESLKEIFALPPGFKLITWMRHPAKRVISNFYYLESRLAELLDEERNGLNILSKMQRTLIEYSRAEINRNRQAKFLRGSRLTDFDFVGIHEHFPDELSRLGRILNWKQQPETLFQNKTPRKDQPHPPDLLHEIEELNKDDMALYEEALRIRKKALEQ